MRPGNSGLIHTRPSFGRPGPGREPAGVCLSSIMYRRQSTQAQSAAVVWWRESVDDGLCVSVTEDEDPLVLIGLLLPKTVKSAVLQAFFKLKDRLTRFWTDRMRSDSYGKHYRQLQ